MRKIIGLWLTSLLLLSTLAGQSGDILRMEANLHQLGNSKNKVDTLNELAWLYYWDAMPTRLEKAYAHAIKGQQLAQQIKYDKGLSDSYMRLGLIAEGNLDFEQAEQYYKEAIELRKKFSTKVNLSLIHI